MPIYEYKCIFCGHHLDELQSINEPPLVKCPKCGKDGLKKLIGTGAGLIFKGSGFYLTDYKNKKSSKVLKKEDVKEKKALKKGPDPDKKE